MTQLTLDFPNQPAMGADDFLVAGPNEQAWQAVQDWPDWRDYGLVIWGDAGCGKTHLARIWGQRAGAAILGPETLDHAAEEVDGGRLAAAVIDDVAQLGPDREEALLHLLNAIRARGGHILMTGREAPARWPISLPDLASRLRAIATVRMEAPDDRLLAAVVVKLLKDRQLNVEPTVIDYVLTRMERSFAAANALIRQIDQLALAEGRAVTVPVARRVLTEMAKAAANVPDKA